MAGRAPAEFIEVRRDLSPRRFLQTLETSSYRATAGFEINSIGHASPQSGFGNQFAYSPAGDHANRRAARSARSLSLPAQPGDGVPPVANGIGGDRCAAVWRIG